MLSKRHSRGGSFIFLVLDVSLAALKRVCLYHSEVTAGDEMHICV